MAANVAVGGQDPLGKALAGWPALSLLVTLKLLFSMLEHTVPATASARPDGPVIVPDVPDDHRTVPVSSAVPGAVPGTSTPGSPIPSPRALPPGAGEGAARLGAPPGDRSAVPGDRARPLDPSAVTDLLPAARSAREAVARSGRTLSRDALTDPMRGQGHALSNARASLLLKILRADDVTRRQKSHPGRESGTVVDPVAREPASTLHVTA